MCRVYFGSRKIDSRRVAERRSTDQSRNGCRMCHFCHAQLFEITHAENIKSPLEQPSCQNAKVVEAFCDAACRLSTRCRSLVRQPPVGCTPRARRDAYRSARFPCRQASTLPRAGVMPSIDGAAQHVTLITFCCPAG